MQKDAFLISNVSSQVISSQHVRELIQKLYNEGNYIYTTKTSYIVIKECLTLGIYPYIMEGNEYEKMQIYILVKKMTNVVERFVTMLASKNLEYNVVYI